MNLSNNFEQPTLSGDFKQTAPKVGEQLYTATLERSALADLEPSELAPGLSDLTTRAKSGDLPETIDLKVTVANDELQTIEIQFEELVTNADLRFEEPIPDELMPAAVTEVRQTVITATFSQWGEPQEIPDATDDQIIFLEEARAPGNTDE